MPATEPIKLSDVHDNLLPRILTGPIFEKSVEQSAIMQLAKRVPLSIDATTSIPVPLDLPIADWVGEGQSKPLSSGAVAVKTMSPRKVAVLIPVSEEVAMTNPGGLWAQLQNDLPTAFARAFDHAAIHGKTMRGAPGPFADYLTKTSQSVTLGTATKANGGIWTDLVNGMKTITNNDYDLNGFVADHRLKPELMLATDVNGRPFFTDTTTSPVTNSALGGTLIGQPLAYSRSVSGKQRRQSTSSDTGLRAIGGDWTQAAFGVGMDITVRISKEATYIDEEGGVHSAFQENLVLLLAEAYYGYAQGDDNAFVEYYAAGFPS